MARHYFSGHRSMYSVKLVAANASETTAAAVTTTTTTGQEADEARRDLDEAAATAICVDGLLEAILDLVVNRRGNGREGGIEHRNGSITKLFGVLLLFLNVRPQQGDDVDKTKAGILEFRSLGLDIVQEGIDLRLKGQELLANSGGVSKADPASSIGDGGAVLNGVSKSGGFRLDLQELGDTLQAARELIQSLVGRVDVRCDGLEGLAKRGGASGDRLFFTTTTTISLTVLAAVGLGREERLLADLGVGGCRGRRSSDSRRGKEESGQSAEAHGDDAVSVSQCLERGWTVGDATLDCWLTGE